MNAANVGYETRLRLVRSPPRSGHRRQKNIISRPQVPPGLYMPAQSQPQCNHNKIPTNLFGVHGSGRLEGWQAPRVACVTEVGVVVGAQQRGSM